VSELEAPVAPGALKLTGLTFGSGRPADAEVNLIVRDPVPLDGNRVEWLQLPGSPQSPGRPAQFADAFAASDGALLECLRRSRPSPPGTPPRRCPPLLRPPRPPLGRFITA
jgi:hypothetical protein